MLLIDFHTMEKMFIIQFHCTKNVFAISKTFFVIINMTKKIVINLQKVAQKKFILKFHAKEKVLILLFTYNFFSPRKYRNCMINIFFIV